MYYLKNNLIIFICKAWLNFMKNKRVIIIFLLTLSIFVLIVCDYMNIITKLGLSVSFWSGFITGIFPIALTIYLWKKEEKDRVKQVEEESRFQKKLILRVSYIEYFENLLEQMNEYIIFLDCYFLKEKDLIIKKKTNLNNQADSILRYIKLHPNHMIWKFNYRIYAFKCIDIDIFNYDYKGTIINLRAFMPYIYVSNQLTAIYDEEKFFISVSKGLGYVKIDENAQKKITIELLNNKEKIEELINLLIYLKEDIEKRISFE